MLFGVLRDRECLATDGGEATARGYLGMLRAAVAREPDHPRALAIVGALSVRRDTFRRLWARNEVSDRVHGSQIVTHPRVGEIAVEWDTYALRGSPGPILVVFSPKPGFEDRLRLMTTATARDIPS